MMGEFVVGFLESIISITLFFIEICHMKGIFDGMLITQHGFAGKNLISGFE